MFLAGIHAPNLETSENKQHHIRFAAKEYFSMLAVQVQRLYT